ncbi:MAG: hypothetical protein II135_04705 [Clostridia bacterium]|nr:hypothetical protein [Clostridia bacterium]MBQ3871001.1 hypothetical protein [Clostridia bacterium]
MKNYYYTRAIGTSYRYAWDLEIKKLDAADEAGAIKEAEAIWSQLSPYDQQHTIEAYVIYADDKDVDVENDEIDWVAADTVHTIKHPDKAAKEYRLTYRKEWQDVGDEITLDAQTDEDAIKEAAEFLKGEAGSIYKFSDANIYYGTDREFQAWEVAEIFSFPRDVDGYIDLSEFRDRR